MSIRQGGLCMHPQQTVIHTHTHSRAAGSGSKHIHAPTVSQLTPTHHPQTAGHWQQCSASADTQAPAHRAAVTVAPRKKPTSTVRPTPAGPGGWALGLVHTHTRSHTLSGVREARATGTTKGKQTRGEFLNHIRMCRREGGREPGRG